LQAAEKFLSYVIVANERYCFTNILF